jgi:hypothetical protein
MSYTHRKQKDCDPLSVLPFMLLRYSAMYPTVNSTDSVVFFVSKKKISRLTKSPRFMHVACVSFYTTEAGERFS